MNWVLVRASLLAGIIGSDHFIGLALAESATVSTIGTTGLEYNEVISTIPPSAKPRFPVNDLTLGWPDILVIVAYFAVVLGVGLISSFRTKRDSVSGYFLASRSMHWIPVGASLFASNIGSGHFVGLAGSGAVSGIGIAGFELNAMFVVLVLGWLFVPVYLASGVYTMPEYLRKRFGGQRIRIYLSVLALLLYVFTKISADLFSGAMFIQTAINVDLYIAICGLLFVSALFTITGGLTAVMWTDFIQTILMVLGALSLTIISLIEVGGYEKLIHDFQYVSSDPEFTGYDKNNQSCNKVPENFRHIIREPSDPELPWPGIIFGLSISAVWYWCSDQVIVQRALSARSLTDAKAGCILAGYLKLTPLFLLVLPGMAARVLYRNEIGCSDPDMCKSICDSEGGCSNIAYPTLVLRLMPVGARGMMLSVMLAALMSSLTSIFNSSSTIFTMDIWKRIRRNCSELELLIVGKAFIIVLVGISIAWIPIIKLAQGSQLFHYIQSVTSFLAPPVCAVYLLAILSERINEQGAFWGLISGLAIGLVRFVLEFVYTPPTCASKMEDTRPSILTEVHYLHFGIILFIISAVVTTVISLCTQPISSEFLYRLTFWTRHSKEVRKDLRKEKKEPFPTVSGQVNLAFDKSTEQIEMRPTNDYIKTDKELPAWRRALYCFCGITESLRNSQKEEAPTLTAEEEAEQAAEFLKENPFWKNVVNANAVLLLIVGAFVWIFYA